MTTVINYHKSVRNGLLVPASQPCFAAGFAKPTPGKGALQRRANRPERLEITFMGASSGSPTP